MVIDEAQIVFEKNPGMAPIMFSQLRAMHIGTVVVHQNIEQLRGILGVLAGNAQSRVILEPRSTTRRPMAGTIARLGWQKKISSIWSASSISI